MRRGVVVGVVAAVWPMVAQAIVLDRVRVRTGDGVRVELSTSGPALPWVRRLAATPETPHRIYIDLADTVIAPGVRRLLPSHAPGLAQVRTGQFTPTTARIVLDTTAELPFDVTTTGRQVTITLGTGDAPVARTPPAPAPPPRPAPAVAAPRVTPLAAPPEPSSAPGLPLVIVDAGHGGHDPGAEGVDGVQEKTVALQMAHRLAAKLPARLPVDSLLTRSDDSFVPLADRLPRRDRKRTIFLSLHANACDQPEPRGVEVFFGGSGAKQLARLITTELRARLLRVRGRPRPGPFTVLTANEAPSVLIELGYLTHRDDAARLQDPKYQELITDALVDAVAAFLQRDATTTVHRGEDLIPSDGTSRTAAGPVASGSSESQHWIY